MTEELTEGLIEKLTAVMNKLAAGSGFANWGVASLCEAVDKEAQQHYLRRIHEQGFAQMGYLERNLELRFNPQELVPGARSIIVFLVPFGSNERIDNPAPISVTFNEPLHDVINAVESTTCKALTDSNTITPTVPDGMFCASQFALGQDYHKVIKGKLWNIMSEIRKLVPGFEGRAFVDSAPVLERYWAVKAGLGFIGKNNFLISPKAGIRNFIGSIICNLDSKDILGLHNETETTPTIRKPTLEYTCGSCRKCIDACPSGALSAPFTIEVEKCISYRTIEAPDAPDTRKKLISAARQAKAMPAQNQRRTSVFGCDRCMDACPWNRFNLPGWSEFEPQVLPIPISHFHRR